MNTESQVYKWYSDIKEQALRIPILNVVQSYGPLSLTGLRSHRNGTQSNCPWHGGDSLNFFTDSYYNNCSCFKCGETAVNPISYVMKTFDMDFKEALIKLSEDFSLTSVYNKPKYNYKCKSPKKVEPVPSTPLLNEEMKEAKKRSIKEVDFVYRLVLECAGLTKEHQKELMINRYLTKAQIKARGYSSLPTMDIMPSLLQKLQEKNLPADILIGVPGFYVDVETKNICFEKYTTIDRKTPLTGIMIPIPDKNGYIRALQVRRDKIEMKKDGQLTSRYFFLSSTHRIFENKGSVWGCSCGSPIGVIYPEVLKTKMVFITEGMFKAEILSRTFGAVVIVVQGVNSTKNIDAVVDSIKNTLEEQEISPERIGMAFDADSFKHEVYMALKKVSQLIKERFPQIDMYYLLWNPEHGKGIDDLINGNPSEYMEYIKNILKDTWDAHYLKAYERALDFFFTFNEEVEEDFQMSKSELIHFYALWRTDIKSEKAPWKDRKFYDFFSWIRTEESKKENKEIINEYISKELFERFN